MTLTTIKLSKQTRDLLKAQAEAAQQTMGEYLHDLATAAERRARFEALRKAIESTGPQHMSSHAEETTAWERTELADE